MPQVIIKPSDHAFACAADETVLEAAMKADLIRPYGCRNGACGSCKGEILEGSVDYGPHQTTTLTDDEKRAGFALFCCEKPTTDLVIKAREVCRGGDIPVKRLPVRIESIDKPASDVAIVRLKLPATERLQVLVARSAPWIIRFIERARWTEWTALHGVGGLAALDLASAAPGPAAAARARPPRRQAIGGGGGSAGL